MISSEDKGRLKIYFGYSAGVGKTYAMLESAQTLKKEGIDVVIGYVEPHARPDTINMAEGLETVPLKKLDYKGIVLSEFDVDAAIARHPQLLLIDELAHTNALGSKNKKRYLDVLEVINHGIDVYTTVNVQHIEGLNDLIDTATSVSVNERIPDEIFDYADEVTLVDIEPTQLIERMREGKIYKKNQAAIALENFFKEDKLSSLREISMRRCADKLEKQTFGGEKKCQVLVLISPSPSSHKNICVAARMAEAYHCSFSAMYVETSGELSDDSAANLKKHMELVRNLGGEIVVKYGEDVVEAAADYIRIAGVTNLILGKTWQSVGKKLGLEDRFIEKLPEIEVLIVPDKQSIGQKAKFWNKIAAFFGRRKYAVKYKIANRTLDSVNAIADVSLKNEKSKKQAALSQTLSNIFMRSTQIISDSKVTIAAYNNEDTSFFDGVNERAVAEWCKINLKSAGKGTDTLRDASAIYYPIPNKEKCVCVVAFSCVLSKLTVTDKMLFTQLVKHIALCMR